MKTRSNFVSNSSSSSFVVLAKDADIKAALNILSPAGKKFIKNEFINNGEKVIINGEEYKLYFGTYHTDNWPIDEEEFGTEEDAWEQIKCFERNVKPLCRIDEY